MLTDPWFYAVAVPAMIILGLSKGGFSSLGLLTVPLMALVISPIQAAGIAQPILILSDVVAVISYWGIYDRTTLRIMLPGSIVGILIGWLTVTWVTENEVRLIVGLVAVLFALNFFLRHRSRVVAHSHNVAKGTFWSLIAGFTSFVSHAGGPPFQVYAAPLRLEPRLFAGTAVVLFAIINLTKTIPYFFLGQFDRANLLTAAVLLPVSILSTFLGVWLVKRFRPEAFYDVTYATIFIVGAYLVVESLVVLF